MSGSKGASVSPWLVAIVVTLAAFMEVLDTTIVNVSLPYIAGSLAVSRDNATWSLTTYLVANGIVLTISSSLGHRLGRKKYFLISIAGFTVASLACGISTSFVELLLFRGIQGLFGGGLQPMQQAIILQTFPPEKRQQAFSITAVATIVAPVLGPLVGGYLTDTYSWHWVFLINVPVGIATVFGVMFLVESAPEEEEQKRNAPPFDWWGLLFISLALGCMEVGADRGEDYDWLGSGFIRTMFALSIFGYLVGIAYLLYAKNPAVNLRVFKDRNFALSWFCIAMMGFVLYASAVVIPQFAQEQLGYNATWAGLVLAPGGVVLVCLIPVVGLTLKLMPTKYVIACGGIALAAALYYSMSLVPGNDFYHLVLFRSAQTAALSLLFVPISSAAYSTVPKELNDDAASLFSMARNVYGGVGISISTALVTEQTQVRQHHLVQNLDVSNPNYNVLLQQIQGALVSAGTSMEDAVRQAPNQVFQLLEGQSAVLAYYDVFLVTACMSLTITAAALMMKRPKAQSGGGGA